MFSFERLAKLAFTYYLPLLMVDYFFIMLGYNYNIIIMYPLALIIIIKVLQLVLKSHNENNIVSLINVLLVYKLLSVVMYLFNGLPIECYTRTLQNEIFPLLFFYLGYAYSNDYEFNKKYLLSCSFCFIVGIYLYLRMPDYYVNFLSHSFVESNLEVHEDGLIFLSRMGSFFGSSYVISFFSIPSLVLSLSYLENKSINIKPVVLVGVSLISFVSAILSGQRIAIVFAVFIIFFFAVYFLVRSKNRIRLFSIYVILIIIVIVAVVVAVRNSPVLDMYINRLFSTKDRFTFESAISERMGQYTSFDRYTNISLIFGLGLGSCGHISNDFGFVSILDGEYLRLFYENGIVGFSLFLVIIFCTLNRLFIRRKYLYAEGLILIFNLTSMIGANSLEYFLFSFFFWYTLGHVWNPSFNKRLRKDLIIK